MSGAADPRLDALLQDLPPAPPVPVGLQVRVLAAAAATPQEARPAYARRNARDRRGKWLRRPLFVATAALGLVFTSAVAATLAGVPIPQKLAAVFFPETKAPEPKQAIAPRRVPRPAPTAAPLQTADAAPAAAAPVPSVQPDPWRRLFMAERIIAARRAMGLPTPGADRLARQLRHRAQMWDAATPEQRQAWIERQQLRQDLRRAMLSSPEGRDQLARQDQQNPLQRWRGQRAAPLQPTPEQRAERQHLVREWRARRMAGIPLSPAELALRQERRQWRATRQGRWQTPPDDSAAAAPIETEGPPTPGR